MELVVVNGANNIAKSVIRRLTAGGHFAKVRLLDFRPHKQSVYALQRELTAGGVTMDKRMTRNAQALDIALEGADKVLYFTHDYTNMTSDKNNFLVGTAKLAKKHGVDNMVAVCPVEHDFAYSETGDSWVQKRQEAEKEALSANGNLSILSTDLVYGEDASHMVHFMQQCAMAGKINGNFLSGSATFQPVHQADLLAAIKYAGTNNLAGQWAVRGNTPVTVAELMHLVEASCGKAEGSTTAMRQLPLLPPFRMMEEFFFGMGVDTNMAEMVEHFSMGGDESPVTGPSIWEKTGKGPQSDLHQFFAKQYLEDDDERLVFPTFGSYKAYTD